MKGAAFEGMRFRHPWIDRDSPGVLGDYVTLDTGTGVVHTAPGHGWDDYLTGVRYGLDIYCPVDEAGRFLPEVERFAGRKVFDANPEVVALLAREGRAARLRQGDALLPRLLALQEPDHLPRHVPVVHRPRPRRAARARARRHRRGALVPRLGRGAHPQHGRGPPRLVHLAPAPVGRAHPRLLLPRLQARRSWTPSCCAAWPTCSRRRTPTPGTSARPPTCCPKGIAARPCGGAEFDKEKDILDVWFDSGSSHAAVLARRPGLRWPADVYLEGSDQHRGWFHSSLLVGVATRGGAPYRSVVTHGFTIDAAGKKISKSVGNDVDTRKIVDQQGAEILRLWTIMVDYREDMRFSQEMLPRLSEAYRKVRNTCRYLLSNLFDFDPARDAVRGGRPRGRRPLRAGAAPPGRGPRARGVPRLRVPRHLPPGRPVLRGRPVVLLPRRAEGPALLRRRRTGRGAGRRRPCSTAWPWTWPA